MSRVSWRFGSREDTLVYDLHEFGDRIISYVQQTPQV